MKFLKATLAVPISLALSHGAQAAVTPEGLWRTYNDKTGEAESLVRISNSGGAYIGVIETILDPDEQGATCELCTDARKGKPVLGMKVIRDIHKSDNEEGLWEGGRILDVRSGKDYKVHLRIDGEDKEMRVRGYLGFSLIGRTSLFERIE